MSRQEKMDEFVKEFGQEGVSLMCDCWYFNTSAYEFTFQAKRLEQTGSHSFSIFGDIVAITDFYLAQLQESTIVPKKKENVVLVYDIDNRELRFAKKISGLTISPNDNGEDGWSRLLGVVGKLFAQSTLSL